MRNALPALLLVALALPAHASAPGGDAPRGGRPVVAITGDLETRVGVPLTLDATVGGAPAAGRVAWAVAPPDAAGARLAGRTLTPTRPGGVAIAARAAAGTAHALVAASDGRAEPMATVPAQLRLGSGPLRARHGAPTGQWLVQDAARLTAIFEATFGKGARPQAVDFATRSVVALVGHWDGEGAVVTHVTPGRPATVHVVLTHRRDANAAPGPASAGAALPYFWTIPRLAGPARVHLRAIGGEATFPLE